MRRPSIRDPCSVWDILAVLALYGALEYVTLQVTGTLLVRQELVIVGVVVWIWVIWAAFHVLNRSV